MPSESSSVRIDLSSGQIEISGSEAFVKEMLQQAKDLVKAAPKPSAGAPDLSRKDSKAEEVAIRKTVRKAAGNAYVLPVPFNLKGQGKISLPEFFKQKNPPRSHEKLIVFFTYWLNRLGGIPSVSAGHLMYAYQELGLDKPGNPSAAITNAKARSRMIVTGPELGTIRVNNLGENYVNSLPAEESNSQKAT